MFSYATIPSSCVGQPKNWPVQVYDAYQPRVECRGYQKELRCLVQMESLMGPRIDFVHFKCDCGN
jgi:hypothetical protein